MRDAIHSLCSDLNYDPFKELIALAQETQVVEIDGRQVQCPVASVDQRIAIAKEVAQYLAPKLKGVEVQGTMDASFTFKVVHFSEAGKSIEIPVELQQIANQAETKPENSLPTGQVVKVTKV